MSSFNFRELLMEAPPLPVELWHLDDNQLAKALGLDRNTNPVSQEINPIRKIILNSKL